MEFCSLAKEARREQTGVTATETQIERNVTSQPLLNTVTIYAVFNIHSIFTIAANSPKANGNLKIIILTQLKTRYILYL